MLTTNALQFVTDIASQTITLANLGPQMLAQGSLTLDPTSSSTLPVTLESSTPSVCTVASSDPPFTVTLVSAGTCTLTASQVGNANYAPATPVSINFAVQAAVVPTPTLSNRLLMLLGLLLAAAGLGWQRYRPTRD